MSEVDHGAMVPLYYLDKAGFDVPIVLIDWQCFPEKLYTTKGNTVIFLVSSKMYVLSLVVIFPTD